MSALLSGVLEEIGRYAAMKYAMHEHDRWRDAISYGIGHGGCELFLGVMPMVVSDLIDGESTGGIFLLAHSRAGGAFHIGLSVLVLASVHYRDSIKYLYIAIALHFAADLIGGLLMLNSAMAYLFVGILIDAGVAYYSYFISKRLDTDI